MAEDIANLFAWTRVATLATASYLLDASTVSLPSAGTWRSGSVQFPWTLFAGTGLLKMALVLCLGGELLRAKEVKDRELVAVLAQ